MKKPWYVGNKPKMKTALCTGATGQDFSYLAELLLDKGYNVYGMHRRTSTDNFGHIKHLKDNINLVEGDLTDASSLNKLVKDIQPDEVYNLGSQSFVPASWTQPLATADITGVGVLRMLEAVRNNKPDARFYQASSSEMFGQAKECPQNEDTPFHPRSPYAVAKVFGHYATMNYRESFGMHASSGILMNHESPRRGKQFVTRKITNSVAKIALGLQDELKLGNINAQRDWGYAGDYVEAMWLMLQQDKPDDYVVASGETHSVREFVEESFRNIDMDIEWRGEGVNECGYNKDKKVFSVDPQFYRPAEVDLLHGDYSKFNNQTGWKPKTKFKELVKLMVDYDLNKLIDEGRQR